jgi:predicted nucleic acid-binding protein
LTPEVVVTNAGPLIALAKLNLLHLLKQLYRQVSVTRAVYDEAVLDGIRRGFPDAQTLQHYLTQEKWQPIQHVDIPSNLLTTPLDRGELESIALAMTHNAVLLMDEESGRAVARRHGVHVRGTLGILVQAFRSDLIDADQLRFHVGELETRPDIWISPALCRRVLHDALGAAPETDDKR